jgi:hypothetical protein
MLISELSPKARELVRLGRALNQPRVVDRERIQDALRARLGAAALPPEPSGAQSAVHASWPSGSSVIVGAILICGALLVAHRRQSEAGTPGRAPAVPMIAASSAAPVPTPSQEPPAASVGLTIAVPGLQAPLAPHVEDRLAEEVAFLTRVAGDLSAGRTGNALKVLDEYQRKFPNGLLTEEWRAARAQALCSLGRRSEAQAGLARLATQPPAAARAKLICDARFKADDRRRLSERQQHRR